MNPDRATSELRAATPPIRTIGLLITAGGLLLTVANVPGALAQTSAFAPAWTAGAAATVAVMLVLAGAGRRLPAVALRGLWIAVPVLGAVLLATWAGAYAGVDIDTVDPWFRGLLPALICYPLLLMPAWLAAGAAVVFCLLPWASTVVFLGGATSTFAANTIVHLGNLMFLAIMLGLLRRLQDVYARETELRDARRREVWARTHAQRQRAVARVVHDEVLATLTAAAHVTGAPSAVLRAAAADALDALSPEEAPPGPDDRRASVAECAEAIAASLAGLPATIRRETAAGAATMPEFAASSMALAAAEAIRNAVRHAGSIPRVTITTGPGSRPALRIDIDDDGDGFDRHALPATRLGVRESIIGRVEDVGGSCIITSAPGAGSSVSLRWPA